MQDRFKFRIIAEKEVKTFNGTFKGQSIYYCNGFIQTKLKTYFFGNNEKYSFLNSQIKTINQCTGLKDKNGKLIYEGDILHCNRMPTKGLCEWFKDGFWVNYFINGAKRELRNMHNWYEVIGNIYENPELLED